MYTVLIRYKKWVESGHAQADGRWIDLGNIVVVENLEDINDISNRILSVNILKRPENE